MEGTKILIVDDSEMNREILIDILDQQYDVEQASDGAEAVDILRDRASEFSVILLDIVMPNLDGFGVLRYMKRHKMLESTAVIMISSDDSSENMQKAYQLGAFDYISRPFDGAIVRHRVSNTMLLYTKQNTLEDLVVNQIYEQQKDSKMMISILSHIVEFRNGDSGRHVSNIGNVTELLLNKLVKMTDRYHLNSTDINLITTASALHDIGKIAVPEEILNKPGKLTPEEFEKIKIHTTAGAEMLSKLPVEERGFPLVQRAYEICRWHHEKYDGSGYPDGLRGDDIPISAQVVAMADIYDALTNERCYKKAFSHEKAIQMIMDGECGGFNPLLLDCLQQSSNALKGMSEESVFIEEEYKTMKDVRDKLDQYKLSATQRTVDLFSFERQKNKFYYELIGHILFSYNNETSILNFNDIGIQKLGCSGDVILQNNTDFKDMIDSPVVRKLKEMIRSSGPEAPDIDMEITVPLNGKDVPCRCLIRSVWSSDAEPRFLGFAGCLIEKNRER